MKDDILKIFTYDFAISYAGEEEEIANKIFQSIKEKHGDYYIDRAFNASVAIECIKWLWNGASTRGRK